MIEVDVIHGLILRTTLTTTILAIQLLPPFLLSKLHLHHFEPQPLHFHHYSIRLIHLILSSVCHMRLQIRNRRPPTTAIAVSIPIRASPYKGL